MLKKWKLLYDYSYKLLKMTFRVAYSNILIESRLLSSYRDKYVVSLEIDNNYAYFYISDLFKEDFDCYIIVISSLLYESQVAKTLIFSLLHSNRKDR